MTVIGRLSTVVLLALGTLSSASGVASAQPTPAPAAKPPATAPAKPPATATPAAPTPAAPTTPAAAPTTPTAAPTTPTAAPTTTPAKPATPPAKPATPTTPTAAPTAPTAVPPAPAPAPTPTPTPGPTVAQADDGKAIPPPPPPTPEQLEKAKAAFLAGKKAFDDKQLDVAVEKFKESYRLSRNPLLLYNVGFTFDQMGQKDKALFYYQKFMADAPADAAQRAEVTARAKVLETELAAAAAIEDGGDTATPPTGGKKPPRPARTFDISEFDHQVIEEAPPGRPLDLTAYVPEDSGWVVTMFYRAGGDAKFTSVAMRPRYNEQVGRIPASKMAGVSVQYYLEVRTPDGKVLTRVGKPGSPNIVYLETKARPRYYPDLEDDNGEFVPVGPVAGPSRGGDKRDDGLRDGGYFEVGTRQFRRGKWIATGASVGLLGASLTFYLMAAGNSSSLEGEAALANDDSECGAMPKPCKTFGSFGRSLQQVGQRNELVSRITLGVGAVAVGVAAYYWYKDVKAARKAEKAGAAAPEPTTGMSSLIVVPSASDGYLGGTAALRF